MVHFCVKEVENCVKTDELFSLTQRKKDFGKISSASRICEFINFLNCLNC